MKTKDPVEQLIHNEYRRHCDKINLEFQGVAKYLCVCNKTFSKLVSPGCRPVGYGQKGNVCSIFGCPYCWHRHSLHVLKSIIRAPETRTLVRVINPRPLTTEFRKALTSLNTSLNSRLMAYAFWVSESDVTQLGTSVLYSVSAGADFHQGRRIACFEDIDLEFEETLFNDRLAGMSFWRESYGAPFELPQNTYEGFLRASTRPKSWLRLGKNVETHGKYSAKSE